jgi:hypothetical protein
LRQHFRLRLQSQPPMRTEIIHKGNASPGSTLRQIMYNMRSCRSTTSYVQYQTLAADFSAPHQESRPFSATGTCMLVEQRFESN